jgi:hypothetical protein
LYERYYHTSSQSIRASINGGLQEAAVDTATNDVRLITDVDGSQRETVTLKNARVLWGGGRADGAELPVIRVNLNAVALWWLAGGKEIKAGPNVTVGVLF